MKNSFADRLQEAMRIRGVKQADLCRQTGIPKSAVSQYLSGAFEPKQKRSYQIAQALNVSEAWLMGFDGVPMESEIFEDDAEKRDQLSCEPESNWPQNWDKPFDKIRCSVFSAIKSKLFDQISQLEGEYLELAAGQIELLLNQQEKNQKSDNQIVAISLEN